MRTTLVLLVLLPTLAAIVALFEGGAACDASESEQAARGAMQPGDAELNASQSLSMNGFVRMDAAVTDRQLAPLLSDVLAAKPLMNDGGWIIWSSAAKLPPSLRNWSLTAGLGMIRSALPANARNVRCIGGAALWKFPGRQPATPFHQEDAYASHGSAALWLALTSADADSGCLRVAPSLGFALLEHDSLPAAVAPSGFEVFLRRDTQAAAHEHAQDLTVAAGDVILMNSRLVHGSHAATLAERIAFSPLYEFETSSA